MVATKHNMTFLSSWTMESILTTVKGYLAFAVKTDNEYNVPSIKLGMIPNSYFLTQKKNNQQYPQTPSKEDNVSKRLCTPLLGRREAFRRHALYRPMPRRRDAMV